MTMQGYWSRGEQGDSKKTKRVWFSGSTAVREGMGLCYDFTVTTAGGVTTRAVTVGDSPRGFVVAVPSTSNNGQFAGVADKAYPAVSGGRIIDINEPGSICNVDLGTATTNDTGYLGCSVNSPDAGRFVDVGDTHMGRGVAKPLQTVAVSGTAGAAAPVYSEFTGTGSIALDGVTLTQSTAFGNVLAGDKIIIYGVENDVDSVPVTTAAALANTVASKTSSSIIVLTTAINGAGAARVAFYIIRNNPLCRCLLMDGPESGLFQYNTINDGANTTVITLVGGTTFMGPASILTADQTAVLADSGEYIGQLMTFRLMGAITLTSIEFVLTLTPTGTGLADPSSTLTTITFEAADDTVTLMWNGVKWQCISASVAQLA